MFKASKAKEIGIRSLDMKTVFSFVGRHAYVGEYLGSCIIIILIVISVTHDVATLRWYKKKRRAGYMETKSKQG
jgi:Ca2+/Na+ antiporter